MLKKGLALLLVCLLCIGLVACSDSDSKKDDDKESSSSGAAESAGTKLVRFDSNDCTVADNTITIIEDDFESVYEYDPDGKFDLVIRHPMGEYDAALYGGLTPTDYQILGIGNILSSTSKIDSEPSVEEYRYENSAQTILLSETGNPEDAVETQKNTYDEHGYFTKYSDYDTEKTYQCSYDSAGNLTKAEQVNEFGDLNRWVELEYDGENRITSVTCFYPVNDVPDAEGTAEYEYDDDGRLITRTFYKISDSEKKLNRRYEYEYNASGKLICISDYDSDGELNKEREFEYE